MTRLAILAVLALSACTHVSAEDACRAALIGSATAAVLEWGSVEAREAVVNVLCYERTHELLGRHH